ncbi:MAG: dihydropteroate synthase [Candidatus Electronema sp. V4]|uniref:dihydropteroate synthase n=1 Tax=Candidatus Electronema sp. V4 TaxID=3454756 RepID=UPI00405541F0
MNFPTQVERRQQGGAARKPLTVIGQDMHILNPLFFQAIEEKDSRALAAMAKRQVEAGADALDLNLGPAKKNSELLARAMATVLDAAGLPLFVPSQIAAQPDLLQQHRGKITINSVTADPATLAANMEKAGKHEAGLVVLLTKPGMTTCAADDRLLLAAEVLETAERVGFPSDKLWLDPLFRPNSQGMPDVEPVLETLAALPLLGQKTVRSLAGLSSAAAFLPPTKRSAYQCRLLLLLAEAGLDAIILNCNDRRLMETVRSIGDGATPVPLAEAAG